MDLLLNILRTIAYILVEPTYFLMFIIVGVMFYLKNRKISVIQRMTMGESINSPLELTLSQLLMGILAGTTASILLGVLGVVFTENSGVELIFLISIFLVFVKPRFVCFSYSASVLGLLSILTSLVASKTGSETFLEVNVLQIMTLVGVLHIVEGFLVLLDGGRGAIPVFSHKDNKIVGGFAFNRVWAIPIAALTAMSISFTDVPNTPNWWPLINSKQTLILLSSAFLTALPMYGMIGYNAVTFTQTKKRKILISSLCIIIYGVSLALVAQIAQFGIVGELIVVIYAPLAHEGMMKIQKYIENKNKYLYYSDENGIAILEVTPGSPADSVGIKRGDKIIAINDQEVVSEVQVLTLIKDSYLNIKFKIMNSSGEILDYIVKPKNKKVGILLVPRMVDKEKILGVDTESFRKVLEDIKNKKIK